MNAPLTPIWWATAPPKMRLDGDSEPRTEAQTVSDAIRIIRMNDLEPSWTVLRPKEPGFIRSLVTWLGGPEGYINTNPGVAIESQRCAVGLMDMGPGQRQPGVHTQSMVETYVILDGMVESFDGGGNKHTAGPLDCLYIPKGVPHGVRTVGAGSHKVRSFDASIRVIRPVASDTSAIGRYLTKNVECEMMMDRFNELFALDQICPRRR